MSLSSQKVAGMVLLMAVIALAAQGQVRVTAISAPVSSAGCHEDGQPKHPPAPTSHQCCTVGHQSALLTDAPHLGQENCTVLWSLARANVRTTDTLRDITPIALDPPLITSALRV